MLRDYGDGKTHTDFVREKLQAMKNIGIVNKETGISASFGTVGINKMISNTAVGKSKRNGFSRDEHLDAVENIKVLFENASLREVQEDKNHASSLRSIKRFVSGIDASKEALITVKESVIEGHHIYSLELEKLKRRFQ